MLDPLTPLQNAHGTLRSIVGWQRGDVGSSELRIISARRPLELCFAVVSQAAGARGGGRCGLVVGGGSRRASMGPMKSAGSIVATTSEGVGECSEFFVLQTTWQIA